MRAYIGNATKQVQELIYRVEKGGAAFKQTVPIGGQVMLTKDFGNIDEIEFAIRPHRKYGMVSVEDAEKATAYCPLVYSMEKPIAPVKLQRVIERNMVILVNRGKEHRKMAAIADHQRLENDLEESGRPETLRNFEASIVEENHDSRSDTPEIAEGVRVNRSPAAEAAEKGRGSRRKR